MRIFKFYYFMAFLKICVNFQVIHEQIRTFEIFFILNTCQIIGFYLGDLGKNVLSGPLPVDDDIAFVPRPVDTSTVNHSIIIFNSNSPLKYYFFYFKIQLATVVENIRDKLAENIHEMWAVSKIENGWVYGERRDDEQVRHVNLP